MLEHCLQQVVAPSWVSGGVSEAIWMRHYQPSLIPQSSKNELRVTMKKFRSDKFVQQEIERVRLSQIESFGRDLTLSTC